jgi:fructokinase
MAKTIISFGEILWDLLPNGPQLGGAPFNFAYRVTSLGHRGSIVSRLGDDALGHDAFQKMKALGMDPQFVQWDTQHPTGTVNIDLSDPNHPDYEIIPQVAYDYIEPQENLLQTASNADCICFGTLNQRNNTARQTLTELLHSAPNTPKLLDINLRKDCYTQDTISFSLQQATMLKLNEGEAHYLNELFSLGAGSYDSATQSILKTWNISLCIITLGEKGAFAMNSDGESTYEPGYKVPLVDPCGSGDAFAAGFMIHYLLGDDLTTCCRFGNALGAIVATQPGATTQVTPQELDDFLSKPQERYRHPEFIGW